MCFFTFFTFSQVLSCNLQDGVSCMHNNYDNGWLGIFFNFLATKSFYTKIFFISKYWHTDKAAGVNLTMQGQFYTCLVSVAKFAQIRPSKYTDINKNTDKNDFNISFDVTLRIKAWDLMDQYIICKTLHAF